MSQKQLKNKKNKVREGAKMNHEQFFSAITEIYGDYSSEFVAKIVFEYIQESFVESELEGLLKKVMSVHTDKYKTNERGTPPGIYEFEELRASGNDQKGQEAWESLKNTSAMSSVFFESLILQAVIQYGFGDWPSFADERDHPDRTVWAKKTFLDLYNKYSKQLPENMEHQVFKGVVDNANYGNSLETSGVKFIGNQKNCGRLLLELEKALPGNESYQVIEEKINNWIKKLKKLTP